MHLGCNNEELIRRTFCVFLAFLFSSHFVLKMGHDCTYFEQSCIDVAW